MDAENLGATGAMPVSEHPDSSSKESNQALPHSIPPSNGASAEAGRLGNALKVRKRTKTGCLTCRRRRIKCGEERPTCKNCTKSKRECEGYIPRVVFKDPVNAYRPDLEAMQEHHLYGQHGYDANGVPFAATSMTADGIPLAPLAPRPASYEGYSGASQARPIGVYSYQNHLGRTSNGAGDHLDKLAGAYTAAQQAQVSLASAYPSYQRLSSQQSPGHGSLHFQGADGNSPVSASLPAKSDLHSSVTDWTQVNLTSTAPSLAYPTPVLASSPHGILPSSTWPAQSQVSDLDGRVPYDQQGFMCSTALADDFTAQQAYEQNQTYGLPTYRTQYKTEPDDDWFDVDSDEENASINQHIGEPGHGDLGLMLQMSAQQNQPNVRSITNSLTEPNMLATYTPNYSASPLMDPDTARVLWHFVAATGPTLNVFERHPSNPEVIFTGLPAPQAQRSLWSYSMPVRALTHQGLLQSMLALSSLHIAKIQRTSPTPSLKHYHYALRRVAKALSKPEKRSDVSTLAATLLLGFYEVTTAEHNKWNSHLSGARELIMEIDFVNLARRIDLYRKLQKAQESKGRRYDPTGLTHIFSNPTPQESASKTAPRLDDEFIRTISGWHIVYDEHGPIVDGTQTSPKVDEPSKPHEIEEFEIKSDLFWWYAKQDVFQSILSGNRLLLAYERWGQCPPRAPMGRQDAAYGTLDHLLILMARLADFAAKDLPRKRRAAFAAEKRVAAQAQSNVPAQATGPGNPPAMHGMIPDPGPIRLPSGFDQSQHDRMYTAPIPSENQDLDAATKDAEDDHAAIAHALDVFFESLGPAFEPLTSEQMTPTATPFGPAIYYRSYSIACIVSLYYCSRIILCRTAPWMPPAAMAAAGVGAASTAEFALLLGRISAGIQPVSNTAPLNPQHGAALMDSCMGLFFAGVQITDAAQRGWLITKLRDISRLTGWQTSALIASGCERAWIRVADLGRGPPYERTMNTSAKDDRVSGRSRDPRLLANPPKDNNDRRYVRQNAGTRVYWAMGILSVEEDMREMSLEDEKEGLM